MAFKSAAQPLAFPGAEGWAATTPGGRGGEVIHVTNLNADGEGSFKAAIEASGPRIVVFDVGGLIDLKGTRLMITKPYITIAGQTAPYPGITIIDGDIWVYKTENVVIQHIRVRPGADRHQNQEWLPDGISTHAGHWVIVDHCSMSWAADENLSASGPRKKGSSSIEWRSNTSHNITFSNNILAEGLSYSTHPKGEHSKGILIGGDVWNVAVIKNLLSQNFRRNPRFSDGAEGIAVNNLIYNPGERAMYVFRSSDQLDYFLFPTIMRISIVGNVFDWGPNNDAITNPTALMHVNDKMAGDPRVRGFSYLRIFMEDNLSFDSSGNLSSEIPQIVADYGADPSQYLVDKKENWNENVDLLAAADLREYIENNVGARPWEIDPVDSRIMSDWKNRTGRIIDFESEVGGFPDIAPTQRDEYWDTDGDGMPDDWERLKGLDPNSQDGNGTDLDDIGYTNIEVYLAELSQARRWDIPALFIDPTDTGHELSWQRLNGNGRLESSSDLENWTVLKTFPSISGKALIQTDETKSIYYRWSKTN